MSQLARSDGQRLDIAAMPVHDQQPGEADRAQRPHDAAQHTLQFVEVQADRAAKRQMVLAHAGPQARQHQHRDLRRYHPGRSDRRGAGTRGVGNDRQMRSVLLKRTNRENGQCVGAASHRANFRPGNTSCTPSPSRLMVRRLLLSVGPRRTHTTNLVSENMASLLHYSKQAI